MNSEWRDMAAYVARLERERDELRAALEKAAQLASIASDWNLDEVEIDGEMVSVYDLHAEFKAALSSGAGTEGGR